MQQKSTRTTWQDAQELEGILKYNPLRFIREAYIRFIQGLFAAAPKGMYHWELDNETTDIVITDENPIKSDTLGKRPCISCTRGAVSFYTLGFDDMIQYDMANGAMRKAVLLPGTMSINCCSRVPLEAEQLAWVVAEHLWLLRGVMRRWGFYDVGRNLLIGPPSPPGAIIQRDGGDEWYVVTITSPFQMNRTAQTTPLGASIASEVQMTLNGQLPERLVQGVPYAEGGFIPYAATSSTPQSPEQPPVGARVTTPDNADSPVSRNVVTIPDPLNPAQQVRVRAVRPGDPALRPPTMRGRTVPITHVSVEQSPQTLQTRIVKT